MNAERVQRFLTREKKKKAWNFSDAPDPRQQGKKTKHKIGHYYNAALLGLLGNMRTLRDVERSTETMGPLGRSLVPRRITDTSLHTEIQRFDEAYLHSKLIAQTRERYRSKMLRPHGLPCGVATVDGKNLATLSHDAGGRAQARTVADKKWQKGLPGDSAESYYLSPVLRAVLSSAEAKPAIAQLALGPRQGESSAFGAMMKLLHSAYGRSGMIEIIDADAGLTSLANADLVDHYGYGYVFGLKDNQPELYAEAKALLEPEAETKAPEARTPWQRRNGHRIRRSLYRTGQMQGIENSVGQWSHLRQVWLVRQETKRADGTVECEDRYFLSNVLWNRLTPQQILHLVRNHWAIENDVFNSLDLQWREDSAPWCTQGTAVYALGVLRLIAYNVVQYLRKRRLCRKDGSGGRRPPPSWRSVFEAIRLVLQGFAVEQQVATPGV